MQTPTHRLFVLPVSPWSERARWALDHHRIAYKKIEHAPFLGERRLRRITGSGKKRATVPVLITSDGQVLTESWDIALFADRTGSGEKLIPAGREAEVRKWNDLADEAMASGRALVVRALLASPQALDEAHPPQVPAFLRPLLRPIMRYGTGWFARKYGLGLEDTSAQLAAFRRALDALREGLSASSPYLLGSFSYADVVMATLLQGVSPVADRHIPLGPATRKVWTLPEVAADFADLIDWRDRLYEMRR